jgi:hypothetical protein
MKVAIWLATAVAVGIAITASTLPSSASSRDAAIRHCSHQAQAQWPRLGSGYNSNGRNRTMAYKACMRRAGYRP